jgi:hypothetical protein
MNLYHGWADLKPGVNDLEFAAAFRAFMEHLKTRGLIEGYRLTRRKLGLGPDVLGEFHFMLEVNDLAQLEAAFQLVSTRAGEVESVHFDLNSRVTNLRFALYRDFPDPQRVAGQEKF